MSKSNSDNESDKMSTRARSGRWLSTALRHLEALPRQHRLAAFMGVLLAGVGVTFVAGLAAQSWESFLTGAPVLAFLVFVVATLALLGYIKSLPTKGLIGLFYFLPVLYALLVFGLAFLTAARDTGNLAITDPASGAELFSSVSVNWSPAVPVIVRVVNEGKTVTGSQGYVQPPYGVKLAPGSSYEVVITTRHGLERKVRFGVIENPFATKLTSVMRAEGQQKVRHLQPSLIIPVGFAADLQVGFQGAAEATLEVFGRAVRDECAKVKPPFGEAHNCVIRLARVPIDGSNPVTVEVKGSVYSRSREKSIATARRTLEFGGVLVSVDVLIDQDGDVSIMEVEG